MHVLTLALVPRSRLAELMAQNKSLQSSWLFTQQTGGGKAFDSFSGERRQLASLFNLRNRLILSAFLRVSKPLCFAACRFPASGFASGTEQWERPEVAARQCKLVWSAGVLCFNVSAGRPSKVMVSSLLQRGFSRRCRCGHLSTPRIQMVPRFLQLRVTFCALQPLSVWEEGFSIVKLTVILKLPTYS